MSAVQVTDEHRACWALLKLAALGTPDRIAAALHTRGIRGDHHSRTCPVATYLQQETGLQVAIRHQWWRVDDTPYWWSMPAPVEKFIGAFARDAYPQLLAHLETEGEPA